MLGGNNVRDEYGAIAVFAEMGASASSMTAAKFLDYIACLPGCHGEDADATKAYTQAHLKDFEGDSETWVEIPEDQWPKEWRGKFRRPVIRLLRNLYGHPLAGLYWEWHCHRCITKCGFERVHGWECLYKHVSKGLFLSVYVDDFKSAGKKERVPKRWSKLGKLLDLDPRTALDGNTYIGLSLIHI